MSKVTYTPQIWGGPLPASNVTISSTASSAGSGDYIKLVTGAQQERLRIDSSGNTSNGGEALSYLDYGIDPFSFQLANAGNGPAALLISYNTQLGGDNVSPTVTFGKSHSNTLFTAADVVDGESVGGLQFAGMQSNALRDMGGIGAYVQGTPSGNSVPSALSFATTTAGDQYSTERLGIQSNGSSTFGGFANTAIDSTKVKVQAVADSSSWHFGGIAIGDNALGSGLVFAKTRADDPSVRTAVQNGDAVGSIFASGTDGADYVPSSGINFEVNGTVSAAHVPIDIVCYAGTWSYGVPTLRVSALGNVVAGTGAIATNATSGFLYVPTCAGPPTGTPTTYSGLAPIVVDSTDNRLYFYSGGAWRNAGP